MFKKFIIDYTIIFKLSLIIVLLSFFIPNSFAVKVSPDGTKYAFMFDGEEEIGTFPKAMLKDTKSKQRLIDTLKLLEAENEQKMLFESEYNKLNVGATDYADDIIDTVNELDEDINVIVDDYQDEPFEMYFMMSGSLGGVLSSIEDITTVEADKDFYIGISPSLLLQLNTRFITIGPEVCYISKLNTLTYGIRFGITF